MIFVLVAVYLGAGFVMGAAFVRFSMEDYQEPGMVIAFWTILWPIAAFAEFCSFVARSLR